ncbi:hypothetical protein ScPMuIL_009110 [Solemya velum]
MQMMLFASPAKPKAGRLKAEKRQAKTLRSLDDDGDIFGYQQVQRQLDEEVETSEGEKSRSGSIKSDLSSASATSLSRQVQNLRKSDRSPSQSSNSLFAEDADDALFASQPKPKAGSKSKAVNKKSLFDDEEEEDLFAGMKTATSKPVEGKVKAEKAKAKTLSLFDDDGDIFGLSAGSKDSDPKTTGSTEADNKQSQMAPPKSISPKKKTPSLSLFGDGDDETEHGDLFGSVEPVRNSTAASNKHEGKRTKSLFDDEDVLFGGAEEIPSVDLFEPQSPPISNMPKAKTEPPAGDILGEEPNEHKLKKPVGGVSLFGGLDPFALKAKKGKQTSVSEKKVPKAKERVIDPLFGESDEDNNEDMFSTSTKPPKPSDASREKLRSEEKLDTSIEEKPVEPEPALVDEGHTKKPDRGVDPFQKNQDSRSNSMETKKKQMKEPTSHIDPLFGANEEDEEDDDMFAASIPKLRPKPKVEQAAPDIFSQTTESESKSEFMESAKEEEIVEPKPKILDEQPKKPVGGVSLFGGVDLFGEKSKKVESENKKASEGPKKQTPPTISKRPVSLFDDDTEEEDLFAPPPLPDVDDLSPSANEEGMENRVSSMMEEEDKEMESEPVVTKPKKPAGAVPMFGGHDLFRDPTTKPEKEKERKNTLNDSLISGREKDDSLDGVQPAVEKALKPAAKSPPTSGIASRKICKIKSSIGINPAALLPGAAPPSKSPEPVAVDFEKPADTQTLESVNKSRAKILTRRRPPSRKGRRPGTTEGMAPVSPVQSPTSDPERMVPSSSNSKSVDMFGNDDMLDNLSTPPPISRLTNDTGEKDIFSDDIFSKSTKKHTIKDDLFDTSNRTSNDRKSENVDIFSDVLNSASPITSNKIQSNISHEDEDDIFSIAPKTAKTDILNDVMDNTADDIFASVPENTSVKDMQKEHLSTNTAADSLENSHRGTTKNKTKKSQAPAVVDEDDIFADSSLHKEERAKNRTAVSAKPDPEIDPSISQTGEITGGLHGKSKVKKKKAVTKDEDLFKDNTDIFADIPQPKPKEKKKKRATVKSGKKIFKEDIDDIFADTTAPVKVKKEKKSASKKAPLDDDTDIFDDPLNAVGK